MIHILLWFIASLSWYIVGRMDGYKKREKEFQNNPVYFNFTKNHSVARVSWNTLNGKLHVTVYDKNLIELEK